MPESICLHIQDRPSGPIRVVEIPWMTVRIGRAAYCEVRLDEPGLADEVCRLQRRGRNWQLMPFYPRAGAVLVQDRSVEGPQPLPFDAPFRIGSCYLTLRQDRGAEPDWGMYQAPSPAGRGEPESPGAIALFPPAEAVDAEPSVPEAASPVEVKEAGEEGEAPPPAAGGEPIADQPAGPRNAAVNPWEARWKAAGARLPSAAVRPPKVARPQPFQATDRYPGVPRKEPSAARPRPVDAPATPPPSRGFSTQPPAAEAPGYPTPPTVPPPSRPIDEAATRPVRFERPAAFEPAPAASFSMRDHESRIEWLGRTRPATPPEPSIDPLERPRPAPATWPAPEQAPLPIAAVTGTTPRAKPEAANLSAIVEAWEFPLFPEDAEGPHPAVEETAAADPGPSPSPVPGAGCCLGYSPSVDRLGGAEPTTACPVDAQEPEPPVVPIRRDDEGEPSPASNDREVPKQEMKAPAGSGLDQPFDESIREQAWSPVWIVEPPRAFTVATSGYGFDPLEGPVPRPVSEAADTAPPARQSPPEMPGGLGPEAGAGSRIRSASLLGPATTRERDRDRRAAAEERTWPVDPGPRAGMRAEAAGEYPGFALPSAKEIMASAPRRPVQPSKGPVRTTHWDHVTPTLPREPGQWNVPLWLAWPPAALMVLAMGAGGLLLACRWAGEGYDASVVAQRLLTRTGVAGKQRPLPETMVPPEPSWWQTTPQHLAQWGVYLGRLGAEEDRAEDARSMLEGAVRISPIHPTARLARAELAAETEGPARSLGLSRDAASLARTARSLRLAGKQGAAIRLYREALQIAGRPDPTTAPEPVFDEDPAVRRYLLPGEAAAAAVVRELFGDPSRSFQEWSDAVPETTIARLAAARLFREQGRPEAEALIAQVIDADRAGPEAAPERAIRHAAAAEAHALLSRWRDAEGRYRQAIDAMDDAVVKRSWWFNLASIAHRLDDETQRQAALQAALDAPASDDISRRAMEFQRASEPVARLRSGATKAN
jgi:tetratricopeptide (TPR) repeat protein